MKKIYRKTFGVFVCMTMTLAGLMPEWGRIMINAKEVPVIDNSSAGRVAETITQQSCEDDTLVMWRWKKHKKNEAKIQGIRYYENAKGEESQKKVTISSLYVKERDKEGVTVAAMSEADNGSLYLLCHTATTEKVNFVVSKANGTVIRGGSISVKSLLKREKGKAVKCLEFGDMYIMNKNKIAVYYTSHTEGMRKEKEGVLFINTKTKKTSVLKLENGYIWKLANGAAYGESEMTGNKAMVVDLTTADKKLYNLPAAAMVEEDDTNYIFTEDEMPILALSFQNSSLYMVDIYGNLYVCNTEQSDTFEKCAVLSTYVYPFWRVRHIVISKNQKKIYAFYQGNPENCSEEDKNILVEYELAGVL